jgi:ABC-type transporter Mla maintaining outer membrane lipid asymmetry ATPase subunit MlaF
MVDPTISERQSRLRDNDDPEGLAIATRDLHKAFGGHRVLNGVDLQIPEGSICAIMGPSETGKSVMIKHILGLLKPDSGEVLVRGRSLNRMSRSEVIAMRKDIGVMFQDGARRGLRRGVVAWEVGRVGSGGGDVQLRG